MTRQDFLVLAPYLAIAGGVVLMLLLVSFWRSVRVMVTMTVLVMLVTLGLVVANIDNPPHLVSGFLLIDGYAALFNIMFVIAAIVTALLAYGYMRGRSGEPEEFYILLVVATLGAMTMAAAHHFAAVLLGLEILSISLYVLIGYSEEGHPPLEAALKYLVLSGVASTTMLFGMALIYNATGTLVFSELGQSEFSLPRDELYYVAGHGLLFAGIAFKLSLVPFHMWTPDVYQGAPAPVTGYLATVSKGAVFAFVLRYALITDVLEIPVVSTVLLMFAVLSMLGGNLLALMQNNVKRLLAYSSIAHIGYLLIGLLAVAVLADGLIAVEASLIYLAGYFLMTLAAFGVVSVLSSASEEVDAEHIDAFVGLFWRKPLCAVIMTTALLSLTGIPLTVGFVAKFYMLATGAEGGMWLLLWTLVIGSAIAVYYYMRVIFTMVRPGGDAGYAHSSPRVEGMAVLVVIGISLIGFGVYPSPLIDFVRSLIGITGG